MTHNQPRFFFCHARLISLRKKSCRRQQLLDLAYPRRQQVIISKKLSSSLYNIYLHCVSNNSLSLYYPAKKLQATIQRAGTVFTLADQAQDKRSWLGKALDFILGKSYPSKEERTEAAKGNERCTVSEQHVCLRHWNSY
jgi:hypothetical protein